MSRSYNLNADHAKQADSGGNRITETGQYVGRFTRAESVFSKKNTEGVEFAFETDSGQSADFLTLWTYNAEGKELFGLKTLNAMMACMKVRTLAPKDATVEKWDRNTGKKERTQATVFPALMGKPIGLLLQREEYLKADNSIGSKFNIYGCFEASTGFVASEILEKATSPEKLAKIGSTLRDKPIDTTQKQRVPAAASGGGSNSFADLDDDIPF